MKARLKAYQNKYDALSMRERVVVLIGSIGLLLFIANTFLLSPLQGKAKTRFLVIAGQRAEIEKLVPQIENMKSANVQDPDYAAKARIRQIEGRIAAIDTELKGMQGQMVPPEKMAGLLEDVLKRNKRLQLVALRTLPLSNLQDDRKKENASTPAVAGAAQVPAAVVVSDIGIFKHGIEIKLRGNYLDMLDYLGMLEKMPWRMHWSELKLETSGNDKPMLTIVLYTLSLDKAWLTL